MKTDTSATTTTRRPDASSGSRVFTVPLHRVRRGRATAFTTAEPEAVPPPPRRPPRAAQMLALAHEFQRLIDSGEVADRATLARQLGFTRARVTQILDLLLLAPDIQESILSIAGSPVTGPTTERQLRQLARFAAWSDQRRAFLPQGSFGELDTHGRLPGGL